MSTPNRPLTALITGASAGIGWEYALQLAERLDHHLLLVARREDRLQALCELITERRSQRIGSAASGSVSFIAADLAEYDARKKIVEETDKRGLAVDWLVNNAGFGSLGPFSKADLDWELRMVEVNCRAPLHLIKLFLPAMLERGRGTIINVCSTCSFQPLPYMATYGGTKAFLYSLSVAISAELCRRGVTVLAHCPGPTHTEFHEVVGLKDKLDFVPSAGVESVVSEAITGAIRGRRVVVNGFLNKLGALASSAIPSVVSTRLVERVLRAARG